MKEFGNDTIVIAMIGVIGIGGMITKQTDIVNVALGALAGFIGAKATA